MRLFVHLRLFKRGILRILAIISHGVLAVFIQETLKQLARQIVREFSILARTGAQIDPIELCDGLLSEFAQSAL